MSSRRGHVLVVLFLVFSSTQAVAAPPEEPSPLEGVLFGGAPARGPGFMGEPFYGLGYRLELARWATAEGRAARLSGVHFTLNRDFMLNIIVGALMDMAESNAQIADSGGWARVGPSSNAGALTAARRPFSLDVTIYDEFLGSELNGAAADLYFTFVLKEAWHGGIALTVGFNATALGASRASRGDAWVSWLGALVDFRMPLAVWWLAARVRATLPFIYGRQGTVDGPATSGEFPEDRRYLARVDALLEGAVGNRLVLDAGLTWGVAQLGSGLGFRADVGVRF